MEGERKEGRNERRGWWEGKGEEREKEIWRNRKKEKTKGRRKRWREEKRKEEMEGKRGRKGKREGGEMKAQSQEPQSVLLQSHVTNT